MKPCGDALTWQCSVLMKPSLTTMSHGGAVPIFVPPERSLNVWYACEPLSGTSQPTIGNPPSSPAALIMIVLDGPALGASTGAAIGATGIGIGAGLELKTLTPMIASTSAPTTMRITTSHGNPALFALHGGDSVSGTASASSLSYLRMRLWTLPSHGSPRPSLGS